MERAGPVNFSRRRSGRCKGLLRLEARVSGCLRGVRRWQDRPFGSGEGHDPDHARQSDGRPRSKRMRGARSRRRGRVFHRVEQESRSPSAPQERALGCAHVRPSGSIRQYSLRDGTSHVIEYRLKVSHVEVVLLSQAKPHSRCDINALRPTFIQRSLATSDRTLPV